jgi:Cu-Zn family superoxide dismutase
MNGGKNMVTRANSRRSSALQLARRTATVSVPLGVALLAAVATVGIGAVISTQSQSGTRLNATTTSHSKARRASAMLHAANGSPVGSVTFRTRAGRTEVEAKIQLSQGMTAIDAFHGFHIHANDKPENGTGCVADPNLAPATWFASADGHLTEPGMTHSQHLGDMPSVLVNADGTAEIDFTTSRLTIADLANRAVVLHAGPDNFGNVPVGAGPEQYTANSTAAMDKTAATGNSGDRIACGVITIDH